MNIWILHYVVFCTIMAISRHKEARSRDYGLLLFRMILRALYGAQYTPGLWTVRSTVYAQPRWQISGPTRIRTWYLQVTSPSRYEWAIVGPAMMVHRLHETYNMPTLDLGMRKLLHETYDSIYLIGLINETYDILGPRGCIHETYGYQKVDIYET